MPPTPDSTPLTDEQHHDADSSSTPGARPRRTRRLTRIAAPAVVLVAVSVLAGATLTSGPAPEAEAAVPDHLLQSAQAQLRTTTSAAWFTQVQDRSVADARIAEEQRLAAEAAAAEAARLAEEARLAAAQEATRNAQRDPQAVARLMVADRGWGEDQMSCLVSLWNKESGWNYAADNPSSSAYGIPQSLPGSKMASAGADWETNPVTQITWGLGYIENRYGTPCGAWSHSKSYNWY